MAAKKKVPATKKTVKGKAVGNVSNLKHFKKGHDPRRNTTGANKGSKWQKNLFKKVFSMDLGVEDMAPFKKLEKQFPKVFKESPDKNYQLFLVLRQLSLVFSGDEKVAQRAITAILDRVDGKPVSTHLHAGADGGPIEYRDVTDEDLDKKIKALGG